MTEDEHSESLSAPAWSDRTVWFERFIPREQPWGSEELLNEVPDSCADKYVVRLAGVQHIDGNREEDGNLHILDGIPEILHFAEEGNRFSEVAIPWYPRMIPSDLMTPQTDKIDRSVFLKNLQKPFVRSLAIILIAVGVAIQFPNFLFIALIAGTMMGLFPLIQVIGMALQRVDQLSVEELNRRQVNHHFFFTWMQTQSSGALLWGTVLLVVAFLGQMAVGQGQDLNPSIKAAALVKAEVFEAGEWWRLLTTGLLHGGLLHLFFNASALFSLGKLIRVLASPALLAVVFLFSVITGSVASLYFGSAPISVGASGGILGCLGFLLVAVRKFKGQVPGSLQFNLLQSTIVVAIFGAVGGSIIDNAAHAGGFGGGILLGLLFWKSLKIDAPVGFVVRSLGGLSLLLLLIGFAKVAMQLWALR